MILSVEQVTTELDGKAIVRTVDLAIDEGKFVGLIGPNGSGKSTLLRTIYRVYKPAVGLITLKGDDVFRLSHGAFARRVAVVGQESHVQFDFPVREIVLMGRHAHQRFYQSESAADSRVVEDCLERVGMLGFQHRSFLTLSGGEKQRVLIARALAQEARFFILDEPTNHLDIQHKLQILEIIRGLGHTTLAALHDLNLAAAYCHELYVIHEGKIAAHGSPHQVLTHQLLEDVFRVKVNITEHPLTGQIQLLYSTLT